MEDPGVDGCVILRWNFRKWDVGHGLDRAVLEEVQATDICKCNEVSAGIINVDSDATVRLRIIYVFCIREILEKRWEYNEAVHQLFIDF